MSAPSVGAASSGEAWRHRDFDLPETVVVDTSALINLLIDPGELGHTTAERLRGRDLAAPGLMFTEVANTLRTKRLRGELTDAEASMAYSELLELPIESWPFEAVEHRVWDLRESLTVFDATFVALAELLTAPLVTSDGRLARAVSELPLGRVRSVEVIERSRSR